MTLSSGNKTLHNQEDAVEMRAASEVAASSTDKASCKTN